LTKVDLFYALTGFRDAVRRGEYKKIPLDSYRALSTAARCNCFLTNSDANGDYIGPRLLFMLNGQPRYITLEKEKYDEFSRYLGVNYGYYAKSVSEKEEEENFARFEYATSFPLEDTSKEKERDKENNMNIPSMNLDFGPAPSNYVRFSPYGMAIKSNGQWLVYDAKNGTTVDVTGMTFDFGNMIYKMPVAIKDVRPGDVIVHKGTAVFVAETAENKITGVDISLSEEKTVIPVTNIFGFNFVTKLTPLVNFNMGTPSPDQPFGNIMQMMLLSQIFGKEQDSDGDFFGEMSMEKLMMLSMLTGQQNPFANLMSAFTSTAASQETAQA